MAFGGGVHMVENSFAFKRGAVSQKERRDRALGL
jgi:hypothetical protein